MNFFQRQNLKPTEPERQKPRRKSRWFFADTCRANREEAQRLKSDVDYRAFKNQNKF